MAELYLWQANWVQYRSTAEALKHEKYLYFAATGLYSADDWHRFSQNDSKAWFRRSILNGRKRSTKIAELLPVRQSAASDTTAPALRLVTSMLS